MVRSVAEAVSQKREAVVVKTLGHVLFEHTLGEPPGVAPALWGRGKCEMSHWTHAGLVVDSIVQRFNPGAVGVGAVKVERGPTLQTFRDRFVAGVLSAERHGMQSYMIVERRRARIFNPVATLLLVLDNGFYCW